MSHLPLVSLRIPCQSARQGKNFPCCCTEICPQGIDLVGFSVEHRENLPGIRCRQGSRGTQRTGEGWRRMPRSCLAASPSLYLALGRRSVAQPGRALLSGGRGRRFKSSHSDQHFSQPDSHSIGMESSLWLQSSKGRKRRRARGISSSKSTGARPSPIVLSGAGAFPRADR